jgi:hypothetical protein
MGIATGHFGLFRVAMTLPDTPNLSFPVTQTYTDGTVEHWDQSRLPGVDVEHPAPTLILASGPPTGSDHPTATPAAAAPSATAGVSTSPHAAWDSTALGMAGVVLLVGAIASGVWLARGRV